MRLQELTLRNLLLSAQFIFDFNGSDHLIRSEVVFVNGNCTTNINLNTFVGDFIQLVVHLKYYIVYR